MTTDGRSTRFAASSHILIAWLDIGRPNQGALHTAVVADCRVT